VQQHPEPYDDDAATDPLRDEEPAPKQSRPLQSDKAEKPRPGVEYDPPVVIE
jgi:hypothetical protein